MKFFNRIKHNTSLGYPRHTESQEDRAPRLFQGYLDSAADGNLSGWGWKAGDDNPVDVDILIDGRFAARLTAANYRDDLETAGIGSGNHGFVYSVFDAGAVAISVGINLGAISSLPVLAHHAARSII